jgi:hypothetical protein
MDTKNTTFHLLQQILLQNFCQKREQIYIATEIWHIADFKYSATNIWKNQ